MIKLSSNSNETIIKQKIIKEIEYITAYITYEKI